MALMTMHFTKAVGLALCLLLCGATIAHGGEPRVAIAKTDRCPVCGMFVHKHPKWVAQSVFSDGTSYFYDGAKDMFKHVFSISKYTPGKKAGDVQDLFVTDYYSVSLIDAKAASYVIGSNVLGPMGHELLPFRDRDAAREFLRDHRGTEILRFQDVTPAIVASLDRRTGGDAPAITLPGFRGGALTVPRDFKGKVTLVHFWDIDCVHCNPETLVLLETLYQKYRGKNFTLVAIHERKPADGDARLRKYDGVSYPMLVDEYEKTARQFGVVGLPTTLLLDEEGAVRETVTGEVGIATLEKLVRAELAKGGRR
jgi:copper chaperone NosL